MNCVNRCRINVWCSKYLHPDMGSVFPFPDDFLSFYLLKWREKGLLWCWASQLFLKFSETLGPALLVIHKWGHFLRISFEVCKIAAVITILRAIEKVKWDNTQKSPVQCLAVVTGMHAMKVIFHFLFICSSNSPRVRQGNGWYQSPVSGRSENVLQLVSSSS